MFKDLSFGTISAVGPNAAIVHYSTDEGINSTLKRDQIYLLDAGAQYKGFYFKYILLLSF